MQPPMKTAAPMPGGNYAAPGPTASAPMYAPAQQQFGQFPIEPALPMPSPGAPGAPGGDSTPFTPSDAPPAYQEANEAEQAPPHTEFGSIAPPSAPPSYDAAWMEGTGDGMPPDMAEKDFSLSEEQAREALLEYVGQNCCYGSRPAKKYKIQAIDISSSFHYILETFTESRTTAWQKRSYRGGAIDSSMNGPIPAPWAIDCKPQKRSYCGCVIDSSMNGPIPAPWAIDCKPQARFQDATSDIVMPHSEVVKQCQRCHASGHVRCHQCHGRGSRRCHSCHGRGMREHGFGSQQHIETCHWCHGSGHRRCHTCHGHGSITCSECDGSGQLCWYLLLTVTFHNHVADKLIMRSDEDGPDEEKLKAVSGESIYKQEQFSVNPISHMGYQELNQASVDLITEHSNAFPMERRHGQRQRIECVPVFCAKYKYKKKPERKFWVYGNQKEVFAPSYEATCCGCCVIC